MKIYIVAWSGGYDAPSYAVKLNAEEAMTQGKEWMKDAEDGDWVDVLEVDPKAGTVKRLEKEPWSEPGTV